jgi:hypothetical protein
MAAAWSTLEAVTCLAAEQLGLQHVGRHRSTVEGNERLVAAAAQLVEATRHTLLAGTALANDQHAGVGWSDPSHLFEQNLHRQGLADQGVRIAHLAPQLSCLQHLGCDEWHACFAGAQTFDHRLLSRSLLASLDSSLTKSCSAIAACLAPSRQPRRRSPTLRSVRRLE